MNSKFFNQYELEFAIHRVLDHTDEVEIAKRVGKPPGSELLSQYLSPNNDRESPLYKAACILAAEIDIDHARGLRMLRVFNEHVERALPDEGASELLAKVKKCESELQGLAEKIKEIHR
jgi:hypothetical protein